MIGTVIRLTVGALVAAVRRWHWARYTPPLGQVSAQWLDEQTRRGT